MVFRENGGGGGDQASLTEYEEGKGTIEYGVFCHPMNPLCSSLFPV